MATQRYRYWSATATPGKPYFVTREDIYDAFARKETFATTGPRIRVRLFGGWDYNQADATSNDFVKIGYDKGVPMGGDLAAKPATAQAPSFLVWAMKDADSGNLDRIQIVKGWIQNGQSFEQVYDVALADGRQVDSENIDNRRETARPRF